MTTSMPISKAKVAAAFITAIAADILQIPVVLAMFAATATVVGAIADVPLETLDTAIDVVTACVVNSLLGFHWTLLPSFVLELVPGLDAAPIWTLCVANVYRLRKNEGRIEGTSLARIQ